VALTFYNTLTRQKEPFRPLDPAHVRMYVCGPTVYDLPHVGNARPVIVFDVLYRLLRRLYPRVTYVRNVTDVDDKINARAKESGESIRALTLLAYQADMAALGALPPTVEPRATEHVAEMIAMILVLIAKGHAYVADGHVLFSVPSMADYGALSRRDRDEMIAGARVDVAPYKRDPADFVLWKPSDPDIPGWDSPWGRGRPGWHIECSAMARKHLGVSFDIHGGGIDLIFPHHENEIAQSVCAHGAPFAHTWMHNGFVVVNDEKMSKSLGNFFTVRDVLAKKVRGEAIRLTLLTAHYRQPLNFTWEAVVQSKAVLDRFYQALWPHQALVIPKDVALPAGVRAALEDDLNTPQAIAELHELATSLNNSVSEAEKIEAKAALLAGGDLLGLLSADPEVWLQSPIIGTGALQAQAATMAGIGVVVPTGSLTLTGHAPIVQVLEGMAESDIQELIDARAKARAARDFKEADRIRDELRRQGIELQDGPQGTRWRRSA
jgi:cysteinyl-tRNA synthetase